MENAHFPPLPSFLLNSNPGFVRKLKPPGYSRAFEHIPELRSDPAVSRHTWGVVTHDFSHFSSIQSGDSTTNHESKTAKIHLPNWCLQGKCLQVPFTLEPATDVAKHPPEHIDLPPHGRSWSPRSMSDVSTLPHSKHPCMLATTSFDGLQGTFLFNSSTKKNTKGQSGETTNDGDVWIFCSQHTWHHSFKVEMLSAHGSEGNFQRLELQVLEFPFGPQAPTVGEGIDDYADLFLVFSSATILHLEIFQLRSRTGPKKFAVSQVI